MAVYTEVPDDELARFVDSYGLGPIRSFKGIAEGVENTNYLLDTDGGRFILTLYEKRVDPADLPFFLGLMEHLSAKGLTCPLPRHDRTGQALRTLAGRPAAIVTYLDGMSIRRPEPRHCQAVGGHLARLHSAGRDFAIIRANALGLPGWRPLFDRFSARADEIAPGLGEMIASELGELESNWPRGLPSGVIHADLFPDNVFFLADTLSGIIDFYFACNDAFAYDLAICLNAWCFEPDGAFNSTKARGLIRGYRAERELTTPEVESLPLLARGSALRFLLTRAYDWLNTPAGALVRPHDPREYLRKLRFHQTVRSARDFGLEA
ncbi:MAG: homoserine kinase [Hyphomicrobiaceae bacterium]